MGMKERSKKWYNNIRLKNTLAFHLDEGNFDAIRTFILKDQEGNDIDCKKNKTILQTIKKFYSKLSMKEFKKSLNSLENSQENLLSLFKILSQNSETSDKALEVFKKMPLEQKENAFRFVNNKAGKNKDYAEFTSKIEKRLYVTYIKKAINGDLTDIISAFNRISNLDSKNYQKYLYSTLNNKNYRKFFNSALNILNKKLSQYSDNEFAILINEHLKNKSFTEQECQVLLLILSGKEKCSKKMQIVLRNTHRYIQENVDYNLQQILMGNKKLNKTIKVNKIKLAFQEYFSQPLNFLPAPPRPPKFNPQNISKPQTEYNNEPPAFLSEYLKSLKNPTIASKSDSNNKKNKPLHLLKQLPPPSPHYNYNKLLQILIDTFEKGPNKNKKSSKSLTSPTKQPLPLPQYSKKLQKQPSQKR